MVHDITKVTRIHPRSIREQVMEGGGVEAQREQKERGAGAHGAGFQATLPSLVLLIFLQL